MEQDILDNFLSREDLSRPVLMKNPSDPFVEPFRQETIDEVEDFFASK